MNPPDPNSKQPLWRRLVAFIIALAMLGIGILLLVDFFGGSQTAAAFTRVGGQTHVETALEASRLWYKKPGEPVKQPVAVSAVASREESIILGAAQCAMARDVPLFFRSGDPKQKRVVDAKIDSWGLHAFDVTYPGDVNRCMQGKSRDEIKGLSAYDLPDLPFPDLPVARIRDKPSHEPRQMNDQPVAVATGSGSAPARDGLAPVVVFAAEWSPGFAPDIAVGLALAAHMARADGDASLVVVSRYVEANPKLDALLREQRRLVKGGVILGDQKILSENTRALLRQLLTATDRQGFLGEARTMLGSIEPLVAALVALFALGAVYQTAPREEDLPKLGEYARKLRYPVVKPFQKLREFIVKTIRRNKSNLQPTLTTWLESLGNDQKQRVTIGLISGDKFTGTLIPPKGDSRAVTVIQLHVGTPDLQKPDEVFSQRLESVFLRVEDIESIGVFPQRPAPDAKSSPDGNDPAAKVSSG